MNSTSIERRCSIIELYITILIQTVTYQNAVTYMYLYSTVQLTVYHCTNPKEIKHQSIKFITDFLTINKTVVSLVTKYLLY